jgi:large subunit ribosomal protein L22
MIMEVKAVVNNIGVAPRKVRLVADGVRRLSPSQALATLSFVKKRASKELFKTLENAVANAKNKNLNIDELSIKTIDVLEGRSLKRFRPSTRGRTHPYKKRTTNIRIVLSGKEKANGTKD